MLVATAIDATKVILRISIPLEASAGINAP
jgi:hypothetical protein